jgi:DNA-binding NtrC family response regulator
MAPFVLLVEPDDATSVVLQQRLAQTAEVVAVSSFPDARLILRECRPDLLVTNLRLAAYNGLHLVAVAAPGTPSVVYSTAGFDRVLALEAQRQPAFYESDAHLPTALPAYVNALVPTRVLPARDRRDVTASDGRAKSRESRRTSDIPPCT